MLDHGFKMLVLVLYTYDPLLPPFLLSIPFHFGLVRVVLVVAFGVSAVILNGQRMKALTQMEVVVLCVSEEREGCNEMHDRCGLLADITPFDRAWTAYASLTGSSPCI